MSDALTFHSFYLVGIKGVAMTALAQCLVDAGKEVRGCDVAESFVTQPLLDALALTIDQGFDGVLPETTECVIYTAAHQGQDNPLVQQAFARSLPTFSHAEALGLLFNTKAGIAVCGVGGKSTTSAMITWILEKTGAKPSFAVGVGNIPGLNRTGRWRPDSPTFVAEADEYVTDPKAAQRGEEITPRFSYLHPQITICTNLKFDHPDVYRDFEHTKAVYRGFFSQIKTDGTLVINHDDATLLELALAEASEHNLKLITYGRHADSTIKLISYHSQAGETLTTFSYQEKTYQLKLLLPGEYNASNALAAIAACVAQGSEVSAAVQTLAEFRSTVRRAEYIGEIAGTRYYDDYAHHPNEIKSVIHAFREWFPQQPLIIAFQAHTFSRTKALFNEFVNSFTEADQLLMIDIFASAREAFDPSVTADMLCQAISAAQPQLVCHNLGTLDKLAEYCQTSLPHNSVVLTLGAGDIYHLHQLLKRPEPNSDLATQLSEAFPTFPWRFNHSLAELTYFKIGGPAEAYVELSDAQEVASLAAWCHQTGTKLTLLGGASNVVIADEGIRGVTLKLLDESIELLSEPGHVRAGAGIKMATLVSQTVSRFQLTGLEYFLGVPGTLGGAVYNNSHYLAHLIGEHISRVYVADHQGKIKWLAADECELSYDHSRFQTTKEIILAVEFSLEPGSTEASQALIKEATLYRATTQPLGIPNSGCIFQNTPNTPELKARFPQFADKTHLPSGFLIDQAGLKGTRIGGVEVSEKHAAFFVNRGQGTAEDVKALVNKVKSTVKDTFGVELREEVFYLD